MPTILAPSRRGTISPARTGLPVGAAEAIPLFEKNVVLCERLFGADHPKTLASRRNLDRARQELAQAENGGRHPQQD